MITGVIIVVLVGLIAGLILSIASIVFAVPVDEKQEAVRACLPGANCGACGFSGCDGYARHSRRERQRLAFARPEARMLPRSALQFLAKMQVRLRKRWRLSSVPAIVIMYLQKWSMRALAPARL